MQRMDACFEAARASLSRLGIPDALPALHAAGVTVQRTVLGGSHSVAVYPPIDSLHPVDPRSIADEIDCGSDVSLYVHIAFCETRCTFCHYPVQHHRGRAASPTSQSAVDRYLEALKTELCFWGDRLRRTGTAVSSIYVGGGTPLVLDSEVLGDLLALIRDRFHVLPGAEVSMEGSPLTIASPGGSDKLIDLRERGVTRLSFGVQSFDNTVLRYAGRGYGRDLPIEASRIASQVFDNWNIDLVQGLYQGSPAETWENLNVISDLRPPHLTWYHARFADRPQGTWYRTAGKQAGFEDESSTLLGRMVIWQGMERLGYRRIDGNRFVPDLRYVDPFKTIRTSLGSNLLGVGAGAYSHVARRPQARDDWATVFRNTSDVGSYADRTLSGDIPIATGRLVDDEELLATSYATGLRKGRVEDDRLADVRGRVPHLASHYDGLVAALCRLGALQPFVAGDGRAGLALSELGLLFEDEVLALFFSPTVRDALGARHRPDPRQPDAPPRFTARP